jgi:uncharacterized protein (DUF1786 family)
MSRFLMIDIGAGTMDVLVYDADTGEHVKAVAISPVRHVAERIDRTRGPLVVTGVEMGGGPVTEALRRRAAVAEVVMATPAAATLHHDMDKVREWGILVADDGRIEALCRDPAYSAVILADIETERITRIVQGLGWPMDFEVVALCAQDHGVAPKGVSHLDFRHNLFRKMIDNSPFPHSLLFRDDAVPEAFNRLRAMAATARELSGREIYVMDSGMAAMVGAAQDPGAGAKGPVVILDIATSHTVIAALEGDQLAGFVEYHTCDITRDRLEILIQELADGRVRHAQILAEGGHGAYTRKAVGYENIQSIVVTGPKRRLMADTRLPVMWGAPWGDNMMTGTVGLLEAVRRRKGMAPIRYI